MSTENEGKTILVPKNEDATLLVPKQEEAGKETKMEGDAPLGFEDIVKGDVVSGYEIGASFNESTGESVLRYCFKDGKRYVIKIFARGRDIDENLEDVLMDAAKKCRYIVPILAKGIYKGRHYEIIPYFKNGTCFDHRDQIDENYLRRIFIPQMNKALHLVHDLGVFHNDIKPANIFISDDWRSVLLGDFGISKLSHGRSSVTNLGNFSRGYAAPEASRISNAKTDYFSFGVSILVLCPGNPYAGVAELEKDLLNRGILLPDTLDSDLADLIYLLTRYDPSSRIGHEDVNNWLKHTDCFKGVRVKQEGESYYRELPIKRYPFTGKDGKKIVYYDGVLLADALSKNPDQALEHYKAGFLLDVYREADRELGLTLKKIQDKNKTDPELGLALLLRGVKPSLPLSYRGMVARDIKEYVSYILANYSHLDASYCEDGIILSLLKTSELDEKLKMTWERILKQYQAKERATLICNLFRSDSTFYMDGKTYPSQGAYLQEVFKTDPLFATPNPQSRFGLDKTVSQKDRFLIESCLEQDFGKNKDFSLEDISKEMSLIRLQFKVGKLYLGHLPFFFMGTEIKNLHDFASLVEKKVKSNAKEALEVLDHFIASSIFRAICDSETKQVDKKLLEEVRSSPNKALTFYYLSAKNPTYKGMKDAQEIASFLMKKKDFEKACLEVWNDPAFRSWLMRKGIKI